MTLEEIFDNILPVTESGCWLWEGRTPKGYGTVWYEGKDIRVHRLLYSLTFGSIPKGLGILHKCDVKSCCNPSHLYAGTQLQNARDAKDRGRMKPAKGAAQGSSKLTEEDVLNISRDGRQQSVIAKQYGVTRQCIWRILHKETWRHLWNG